MFRIVPKSNGKLSADLVSVAKKWAGEKATARLRVPDGYEWWYYHELGTNGPYEIQGDPLIAFKGSDGLFIGDSVNHPGVKAKHSVYNTLQQNENDLKLFHTQLNIVKHLKDPKLVLQSLLTILEGWRDKIAERYTIDLPGTKEDADPRFPKQAGKLGGQTASDAFRDAAIVDFVEE